MTSPATSWPQPKRSALVVAHPGHELRVHGWLERTSPVTLVLTDGSGAARRSRVDSTRRVLEAAGAAIGPVFGRLSDREIYECIVEGAAPVFTALADEIAGVLVARDIEVVASDAREGYNSGHDVCRAVVDAAVTMAQSVVGREIASYDFLLEGRPDEAPPDGALRLLLDDAALERKIRAARGYPEMKAEVTHALERFGAEAFRVECLRPVRAAEGRGSEMPFYERYGEQQVAAGLYRTVIRSRAHMDPLIAALHRHALERTGCSRSSSS